MKAERQIDECEKETCYESRLIMKVAEAPYFHVWDSSEFPQVQKGNMRYTNWVVMGQSAIHFELV